MNHTIGFNPDHINQTTTLVGMTTLFHQIHIVLYIPSSMCSLSCTHIFQILNMVIMLWYPLIMYFHLWVMILAPSDKTSLMCDGARGSSILVLSLHCSLIVSSSVTTIPPSFFAHPPLPVLWISSIVPSSRVGWYSHSRSTRSARLGPPALAAHLFPNSGLRPGSAVRFPIQHYELSHH